MIVTKDEMCRTAIGLIRTQGYENVNIPMICQACGVTKGSFYHHFRSKDDLVLYWLHWQASGSIHIPQDPELSPKQRLRQLLGEHAKLMKRIGCDLYYSAMVADARNGGSGLLQNVTHIPQVLDLIKEAIGAGEVHWQGTTADLLGSYVMTVMGAVVQWKMAGGKTDIEENLKNQFEILFR